MRTILLFSLFLFIGTNVSAQDTIVYVQTKNHNVYEKIYFKNSITIGNTVCTEKKNEKDWRDYYRVVIGEVDPREVVKRYLSPYLKDIQLTEKDDDFSILIMHRLDGTFLGMMYDCTTKLDHIPIEVFEQIDCFLKEHGNMKEVTSIPRQPVEGVYYISMMLPCSLIDMQKSLSADSAE